MPDQVDWRAMEREATPGRAVGRLLRDQREARGLSIADIEKSLRIRHSQIEAIEEGRFDRLPGAAYIPAFLRAYATHVGLDAEKVLTAYHLSGPVPIKRPVTLPADFPVVEKRAPIGLAVLTVLLVVGAGYGVWHYMPREQAVVAEKVPPVPDRLLASRPIDNAPAVAPPAATPASTAPAQEARPQEARSGAGTLSAEIWPAQRLDTPPPAAPLAPPPVVVAVPAPPPPPVVMAVPAIGQAQAAQPPAPVDQSRAATSPQPAPTPAPTEEAVARQPGVTPAPAPDAAAAAAVPSIPVRVDTPVRVRANSWVELRAPNGDVLAQTYVRAGESYVVPAGIAYRVVGAR
jgi:cytoskeleton protein RodZ